MKIFRRLHLVFWVFMVLLLFSNQNIWAGFGVKAGGSLSFAGEKSSIYNATNLFGFKAGIFLTIEVSEWVSFQPEVYYAMKGGRYYSSRSRSTESAHFDYLEIPLLLNIRLVNRSLDLFFGPYIGFVVSSTELDEQHYWTWRENELKNQDFGASMGIRYHFNILTFEVQYNYGFTNIMTHPNPIENPVHKNRTLALLVGVGF